MYKIARGLAAKGGTARGIFIGINKHYMAPLRGCVNDALLMYKNHLDVFGFKKENCAVLLDELATKRNILHLINEGARLTKDNDLLRIHISTHGSQLPDLQGTEYDGLNEVVVCYPRRDEVWHRDCVIVDNEFNAIFKKLPLNARVVISLDCCHTGTGTRAIADLNRDQYVRYLPPPQEVADQMLEIANEMHKKLASRTRNYDAKIETIPHCPVTNVAMIDILKRFLGRPSIEPSTCSPRQQNCLTVDMVGNVVLYSGCKDIQTSNDTYRSGIPIGAMTGSFLDGVNRNANAQASYQQHFNTLIGSMIQHGDYKDQEPQLEIDPSVKNKFLFC